MTGRHNSLYDIQLKTIDGELITMGAYRGQVLLVVNVASQCGYTPQYAGLEDLYRRYKDRGFVVLGVPCNQFGHQEPGDEATIKQFCSQRYDVTFPMSAKVDVNGPNTHPLYQYLKSRKKGLFARSAILWNFSKFLLDRDGEVISRYGSRDTPGRIEKDLTRALSVDAAGSSLLT
jgi:glutathione peroxidase